MCQALLVVRLAARVAPIAWTDGSDRAFERARKKIAWSCCRQLAVSLSRWARPRRIGR